MSFLTKRWFIFGFLFFCFILSVSIVVNYQLGFYNWIEPETYIRFYLSDGSILDKIFNYIRNDIQQIYRARELSNFFNFLDAELLVFFARIHLINLLSPIHYITVLTLVTFHFWYYAKFKNKYISTIIFLLSCIYLVTPSVFLPLEYFRTAKVLVSAGITLFLLYLVHVTTKNYKETKLLIFTGMVCSITSFSLGILDEFGILYSLLYVLYFGIVWVQKKQKISLTIVTSSLIGLGVLWVYRNYLGPHIAGYITGIYPQLWNAQTELIHDQVSWQASTEGFISYIRLFFANIPHVFIWIPIGLTWLAIVQIKRKTQNQKNAFIQAGILVGTFIVIGIIVVHIMSLKVATITSIDSLLVYYALPWHTFWYGMLCLILSRLEKPYQKLSIGLLVIWFIANSLALPMHIKSLVNGPNKEYFGIAHRVIAGIRNPQIKPPGNYGDETTTLFHKLLYNKEW